MISTRLRYRTTTGSFSCLYFALLSGCIAEPPKQSTLDRIQGTWEGYANGDEKGAKCTITIAGDSLRYYRDPEFWFATTFTLDESKQPQAMHVIIRECAPPDSSIGEEMFVLFKLEQDVLTLAGEQSSGSEAPEEFPEYPLAGSEFRYDLRRAQ